MDFIKFIYLLNFLSYLYSGISAVTPEERSSPQPILPVHILGGALWQESQYHPGNFLNGIHVNYEVNFLILIHTYELLTKVGPYSCLASLTYIVIPV